MIGSILDLLGGADKSQLIPPEKALPGRQTKMPNIEGYRHYVLGNKLTGGYDNCRMEFGLNGYQICKFQSCYDIETGWEHFYFGVGHLHRCEPMFWYGLTYQSLFIFLLYTEVPEGYKEAVFANGCFWGSEKGIWRLPKGIYSTAVGYCAG